VTSGVIVALTGASVGSSDVQEEQARIFIVDTMT